MQQNLTLGTDKTENRLKQTATKALSSQGSVVFPSGGFVGHQTNKAQKYSK